METTNEQLTKENVRKDIMIKCKDHPEWGLFIIDGKYDEGIWEIRNKSGGKVLNDDEFKFWEISIK